MKKKRKHQKLVTDYENQKSKHLEKLATKSLEKDEKMRRFKEKNINEKCRQLCEEQCETESNRNLVLMINC